MKVQCLGCQGKGYFKLEGLDINFECDICDGRGFIDVPDGKKLCPDCKGKGLVAMDTGLGFSIEASCKKCNETGFVDDVAVIESDLVE